MLPARGAYQLQQSCLHGFLIREDNVLPFLGVSKIESSRWQQEASVPPADFEEFVSKKKEDGDEVTQRAF